MAEAALLPSPSLRRPTLKRSQSSENLPKATWLQVRDEAIAVLEQEREFLGLHLTRNVLDHDSFAKAIVHMIVTAFFPDGEAEGILGNRQAWHDVLTSCYAPGVVYEEDNWGLEPESLEDMGLLDLAAVLQRDPASAGLLNPFLYFKGFKSIQAHRMSHVLWREGKKSAAYAIQSKVSELYGVDIHPAARIGAGLMIDHGTGVVIGETAVIGQKCSFLHGVTLGGTRKLGGNRHPKLGNDVLVGCGATLLGNVNVENNVKIGSGSVVLNPLPNDVTAVGNPARIIGTTLDRRAAANMDLSLQNVKLHYNDLKGILAQEGILSDSVNLDPRIIFSEMVDGPGSMVTGDVEVDCEEQTITLEQFRAALGLRFGVSPSAQVLKTLNDGKDTLTLGEYERVSQMLIVSHAEEPDKQLALEEWDAVIKESSNLARFLVAVARMEEEGQHCAVGPDAEMELRAVTTHVLSDLNLAGVDIGLTSNS